MKKLRVWQIPLLALTFLLPSPVPPLFAQTFKPVFAKQYTRTGGPSVVAFNSFNACDPSPSGTFRMVVINGPAGQKPVSGDFIRLNGVEVVDLKHRLQKIEVPLTNVTTDNVLEVMLRGTPGGTIQVSVEGIQQCLRITITSPAPTDVITRFPVLVRGNVKAPQGTEIGVTVNGVAGMVGNGQFAAVVPLQSGAQTLVARVVDSAGNTAEDSIAVQVNLPDSLQGLFLTPSPASGLAPLQVKLQASFLGRATNYQWDFGDGTASLSGPNLTEVTHQYLTPGLFLPRVIVTDSQQAQFSESAPVWVFSQDELVALLQGKWQGLKNALRAGDISGGLQFVVQGNRDSYRQVFENLTVPLSAIDQVLTDVRFVQFRGRSAEFEMLRTDERGTLSYLVRFVLDQDGIWRIKDM